ncbi:MAG: hypothetical protein M3258_03595 [Thermoproteota archaeon]|nr:hypothetical protein [Thermoproteota archaeon]
MARSQVSELKSIQPYDVSFAEIDSDDEWIVTVQKVATAINVQFTESSRDLPFVAFKEFQNLLREEKVFLFGPSGCGKSRAIIELLRRKEGRYAKIFVINPSNPAVLDSRRENITALSQRFGRNDLVIWDNFPEGLVKRDLQNAFVALEILNSRPVQNLYIALKPTYLEMFRGLTIGIPDIYTHEITCDLETMRAMIKAYGMGVEQYRGVFQKFVAVNADNIARALWQKQPLSLTVIDYYKALVGKTEEEEEAYSTIDPSKALRMAQEWLPVYDYFERQFEVMKDIEERQRDVDFLYTLRFCYEAGFDRTHASIGILQKGIFESVAPTEPTRKMGTWVYVSGQNYSMHDSAKNAVRLTEYSRMKIASYLTIHFLDIISQIKGDLHPLGVFLGKNIEFIPKDNGTRLVPDQIYGFMKKNAVFERAFGEGVGESFEILDEVLQMLILEHVDTHIEFGVGLADSLGERFIELDDENKERVLKKIYHGMLFARYFGQSVGRLYGKMSSELKSLVMSHAEKNSQFADGLGMGLGYIYATLQPQMQREIMVKASKGYDLSRGLGFGFGLTFGLLQEEDAKTIVAMADNNSEIDVGFGMGLAVSYTRLDDELRRFVLKRVSENCEFAFGVGIYGAFFYKEACPSDIFNLLHSNGEVCNGLGLGFGTAYFYLPDQFQSTLESMLKNNTKLDDGLGLGIGLVLKHLPTGIQEMFINKASVRNAFAIGLGYGVGYTWQYIGEPLRQKALALANSNNEFARGLGIGLGSHLQYLKQAFLDQIISFADKNSQFDEGFGTGAIWAWPYQTEEDAKVTIAKRMETRSEFAKGVGVGLARVFTYFSPEERKLMLGRLAFDSMLSEGFGEGTAHYLWTIYNEVDKHRFVEQTAVCPGLSKGFGTGLGFNYSYHRKELSNHPCKRLFNTDPGFKRGLGTGIGRAYKYLSEEERLEALHLSEEHVEFAIGFGEGLGTVYRYLEDWQKKQIISYIGEGEDTGFSRGFGIGFGSVFSYMEENIKNEIFAHILHNRQMSLGFGTGFGMHILHLPQELASRIFELARTNLFLAAGLGEGCGTIFPYISQTTKQWLSSPSCVGIDGFGYGFGIGIGKISQYLRIRGTLEEAFTITRTGKFKEGFAIGLGTIAATVSEEALADLISAVAADPSSYAKDFGFAVGHVFTHLDSSKMQEILKVMQDKGDFLIGLGEGIGHNIPSVGSRPLEEAMHTVGSSNVAKGAARGVAESFVYLNLTQVLGMLEYANSNPEFGEVLGEGLGEKFASLDEEKQSIILNALQKTNNFSRALARILPKNMSYLSEQKGQRIRALVEKFSSGESAFEGEEKI